MRARENMRVRSSKIRANRVHTPDPHLKTRTLRYAFEKHAINNEGHGQEPDVQVLALTRNVSRAEEFLEAQERLKVVLWKPEEVASRAVAAS